MKRFAGNSHRGLIWLVLIGAVLLAGVSVVAVEAQEQSPIPRITDQLNKILGAIQAERHHTLRWDTNYSPDSRFVMLAAFANAAVLDKNTGLVWERAPDVTNQSWSSALAYCVNKGVGGTHGWRLPSIVELTSLAETAPEPFVPPSAFVFATLPSAGIWSATTNASFPSNAWYVDVSGAGAPTIDKSAGLVAWCVRGPMHADAY
jgi:hypothetical protein